MSAIAEMALFEERGWRGAVDHELPSVLTVGRGTVLVVSGWLYHERERTARVWLRVGGCVVEVRQHSVPRTDIFEAASGPGASASAYRAGFWCIVPIPPVENRIGVWVAVGAETVSGERVELEIAHVTLLPELPATRLRSRGGVDVVICLTTHNPPLGLLERQLASIRAQTLTSWRCVVSDDRSESEVLAAIQELLHDDQRFELHRTDRRLGFYFNFESLLEGVPDDIPLVALADQDDEWAPDKLATLRTALEREKAVLAYSDQRIVRSGGEVVSPTFWTDRVNYSSGLRRMLAGNTITGATTLFRRELLDTLLPFPPMLPSSYHDHWLALTALAAGRVAYVDRPLSDYVQHADQLLGHAVGSPGAASQRPTAHGPRALVRRAEDSYFNRALLQRVHAAVLLLRFSDQLDEDDRRMLRRVAAAEESAAGVIEYAARAVFERRRETLGYHREALRGLLWALSWRVPLGHRPSADLRRGVHPGPGFVRYRGEPVGFDS